VVVFYFSVQSRGHEIYLYVVTHSEKGGKGLPDTQVSDVRSAEAPAAAEYLGASDLMLDTFPDTSLQNSNEVINSIEAIITRSTLEIIFVHSPQDEHHDHRVVAACALEASRSVPNIFLYENPRTRVFSPNTFIDISDVMKAKLDLLNLHVSQFAGNVRALKGIQELAEHRAFQSRLPHDLFAEAFQIIRCQLSPDFSLTTL
jgi:LmbE family N-acetylglucosaminyl deacetylase